MTEEIKIRLRNKPLEYIKKAFDNAVPIKFGKGHNVIRLLNNKFCEATYLLDPVSKMTFICRQAQESNTTLILTIEIHDDWKVNKHYFFI
jgi:hypothetical protein